MTVRQVRTSPIGWGQTAWYGAEVGVALVSVYALAFISYAARRSGLALLATPDADGGLLRTIIATWLALAAPALAIALILALPAAAMGALTALLLRVILMQIISTAASRSAVAAGAGVCLLLSLGLVALVAGGLSVDWTPATAATLTFWLVLPLALYVAAGALASWYAQRALAP